MKTMPKSLQTFQKSSVILVLLSFGFLTNAQTQAAAQTTKPLKMRFRFHDLGVDGDVVKEMIYDVKGSVLKTGMQCVQTNDVRGPKRVNCSRILQVEDAPVYRKVDELPFVDLLNQ